MSESENNLRLTFSIDAALLRELGERLVGQPQIALGELIKNSYDADATKVVIRLHNDTIEVEDNGSGMTQQEFEGYWMRIGTPHKQKEQVTPIYKRPYAGSKGVGRLATQFLANRLEVETTSRARPDITLNASVDWEQAVQAEDLTKAEALGRLERKQGKYIGDSPHGTRFILRGLKQKWEEEDVRAVAREVWTLRSPVEEETGFSIELVSEFPALVAEFERQAQRFLDLYYARITGEFKKSEDANDKSWLHFAVEFNDGTRIPAKYEVPSTCPLYKFSFDVLIYYVGGKQKFRLKVDDLRGYLNKYGGVNIYDTGFRVPYYGSETDWLRIEYDHAHRVIRSKLLPEELQPDGTQGMRYLPTNGRIFGQVMVNTALERRVLGAQGVPDTQCLGISVTRDRLIDNEAFHCLQTAVRYALDYYAIEEAKRKYEPPKTSLPVEKPSVALSSALDIIEQNRHQLDLVEPAIYEQLRTSIQTASQVYERDEQEVNRYLGLLGALATAGMSALAYEHEVGKQLSIFDSIARRLNALHPEDVALQEKLNDFALRLRNGVERLRNTRKLFSHLTDASERDEAHRYRAVIIVQNVVEQMQMLLRGSEVVIEIDTGVYLPVGSYAEWSALLQNIFLNAVNAMFEKETRRIYVSVEVIGKEYRLLIQDTGSGVNLKNSEELFKPFVR